ncbi:hypothetical protein [Brassicibacter mesophilus]|uniref:hypothetical protein n=1 Tax=Brassicibacter mesophilus TaxID=745119 RepID=UPI003D1CFB6E
MKIYKIIANYYEKVKVIIAKPYNKFRLIYICSLFLTTAFLAYTGHGVVILFISSVMLLNLWLANHYLAKPTDDEKK